MQIYAIALLVCGIAYLAYTLFLKPLKLKAHYSRLLKQKGYKIYEFPYKVHTAPLFEDFLINQKEKGDFAYTLKHVLSDDYDVMITNTLNGISFYFLKPQIIKELYQKDLALKLIKKNTAFDIFKYIIQRGIIFIQKETWKHRRRLISKVFNFQFISSQIPTMAKNADFCFQKF